MRRSAEGLVVDPKSGITNYAEITKAKAVGAPAGNAPRYRCRFALGQNIPLKFLYWELDHAVR
jgi:hypothetical protein